MENFLLDFMLRLFLRHYDWLEIFEQPIRALQALCNYTIVECL